MSTVFGQIGQFVEDQEEWPQYADRLRHFLKAIGVTDSEKKRAVFLATIGPKVYKILCSLLLPTNPGEKEFEDLVKQGTLQPFTIGNCTAV